MRLCHQFLSNGMDAYSLIFSEHSIGDTGLTDLNLCGLTLDSTALAGSGKRFLGTI